jgi:uncharacterized protein YfdQ (DUF2303 family)
MDYENKDSNVSAALEFAEENGPAEPLGEEVNGIPRALVIPAARRVLSMKEIIDSYRSAPERMAGTATLYDLDSFIAHVKRSVGSAGDPVIFGKVSSPPSLLAVYDYGRPSDPMFGKHRASYRFPISKAWERWIGAAGQLLSARAFAELIEDGIVDIGDPQLAGEQAARFASLLGCTLATPARMIQLSRGLTVRERTKVHAATNLSSGETQVQYVNEHTNEKGEPLNVPGAFLLIVPPFEGAFPYQIPVRLRYRVIDQSIVWVIEPWRAEAVIEHAVKEAIDRVAAETGVPIFNGSPEV